MNPAYWHSIGLGTKHANKTCLAIGKARQIAGSGNFLTGLESADMSPLSDIYVSNDSPNIVKSN